MTTRDKDSSSSSSNRTRVPPWAAAGASTQLQEIRERLYWWIRRYLQGGCRMVSEGVACQCPLCDVDRLVALACDPGGASASPQPQCREWTCKARRTADPPEDCSWPTCGCDPYAEKVLAAIEEQAPGLFDLQRDYARIKKLAKVLKLEDVIQRACESETITVLRLYEVIATLRLEQAKTRAGASVSVAPHPQKGPDMTEAEFFERLKPAMAYTNQIVVESDGYPMLHDAANIRTLLTNAFLAGMDEGAADRTRLQQERETLAQAILPDDELRKTWTVQALAQDSQAMDGFVDTRDQLEADRTRLGTALQRLVTEKYQPWHDDRREHERFRAARDGNCVGPRASRGREGDRGHSMTRDEAMHILQWKLKRRRELNARQPYPGVQIPQSIGLTFQEAEGILAVLASARPRRHQLEEKEEEKNDARVEPGATT